MIPRLATFISIDPGFAESNGTGWCIFRDSRPVLAGLAVADDHGASLAIRCEQIRRKVPTQIAGLDLPRVIEHMKVYPGPQQKGDQNDLISLAYLEGVLAAGAPEVHLVVAREWKGNIPKDVLQTRIVKWMSSIGFAPELPRAKEKRGSVLEACGIGQYVLGRMR